METSAQPDNGKCYPVLLVNRVVNCESLADAKAVVVADGILAGGDAKLLSQAELDRMADVLFRYGRVGAADVIRHAANPIDN